MLTHASLKLSFGEIIEPVHLLTVTVSTLTDLTQIARVNRRSEFLSQ